MANEKPKISVTLIVCLVIGIVASSIFFSVVLNMRGPLGTALSGGLGALLGMVLARLITGSGNRS
jgi:uncharacterized membrane protein YeaQ/YmgE (transglycosylase-associated protein family)